MKITLEQIEILAELFEENQNILLTFQLMKGIYHISFQEMIERLNRGEKIEIILSQIYDYKLFEELFLFYTNSESISASLKDTVHILMRLEDFRKKLVKMMIYPFILIFSLLAFSMFAIVYIKPQFTSFYNSFDISVSFVHNLLLNMLFTIPFFLIFSIVVLSIISIDLISIFQKDDYSKMMNRIHFPLISKVIQTYLSLKFSLYYAEFIDQELSVHEMIDFLKNRMQNKLISMIAYEIEVELLKGSDFEEVIENMVYFDDYFKLTMKLSQSYEKEAYLFSQYFENTMNKIEHIIQVLQVSITVFTYFLVGVYITGIYALMVIPMTNMISQL